MTSGRKTGPTTNCAPARIARRAVSASRIVPAPSRNPFGSVGASCSIIGIARGTVIVTSSARTPPSASASTTARSFSGSRIRMTATTPHASIACTVCTRPVSSVVLRLVGRETAACGIVLSLEPSIVSPVYRPIQPPSTTST